MIAFSKLGNYGRLGNQLFQYAFLRTQARRLNTKFYCPGWLGDKIFDLKDQEEKLSEFNPTFYYSDTVHGFNAEATKIKDETEITGFFQSNKYFERADILRWFSFNEEVFVGVNQKYSSIDFSSSTGIHIRLGDYATPQMVFYVPRPEYFKKGLGIVSHKKNIIVFSDEPEGAKKYLKGITGSFIFIEGNKDYEDLYLMSKCRDIVCSPSSFSWWVAYLNKYSDKKIIVPEYWFLPGGKAVNNDIFVEGWVRLKAHRFYDYYYLKYIPNMILVYYRRIKKSAHIIKKEGIAPFLKEFRKFISL